VASFAGISALSAPASGIDEPDGDPSVETVLKIDVVFDKHADLTQEVFVKMVASIETYENRGKFRSWLFTIAANHLRNHWKYESRHEEYEFEEESENDITSSLENVTDSAELLNALSRIPTDQRDCIVLKYYYGFTSREIAEMLKVKEPTVKARIRYGLNKLSILLKGEETDGEEQ